MTPAYMPKKIPPTPPRQEASRKDRFWTLVTGIPIWRAASGSAAVARTARPSRPNRSHAHRASIAAMVKPRATASEVPSLTPPTGRSSVGSGAGYSRVSALNRIWLRLSSTMEAAKVASSAAIGGALISGRTVVRLMIQPIRALDAATASSASHHGHPHTPMNHQPSIAPKPTIEPWAKLTTPVTPKIREMPTATSA